MGGDSAAGGTKPAAEDSGGAELQATKRHVQRR